MCPSFISTYGVGAPHKVLLRRFAATGAQKGQTKHSRETFALLRYPKANAALRHTGKEGRNGGVTTDKMFSTKETSVSVSCLCALRHSVTSLHSQKAVFSLSRQRSRGEAVRAQRALVPPPPGAAASLSRQGPNTGCYCGWNHVQRCSNVKSLVHCIIDVWPSGHCMRRLSPSFY